MPQIVLTPEQMRIVSLSEDPVEVVDPDGQPVASMRLHSAESLEVLARWKRSGPLPPKRGMSGEKVLEFLDRLNELAEHGKVDEAAVMELLQRMREEERC